MSRHLQSAEAPEDNFHVVRINATVSPDGVSEHNWHSIKRVLCENALE